MCVKIERHGAISSSFNIPIAVDCKHVDTNDIQIERD